MRVCSCYTCTNEWCSTRPGASNQVCESVESVEPQLAAELAAELAASSTKPGLPPAALPIQPNDEASSKPVVNTPKRARNKFLARAHARPNKRADPGASNKPAPAEASSAAAGASSKPVAAVRATQYKAKPAVEAETAAVGATSMASLLSHPTLATASQTKDQAAREPTAINPEIQQKSRRKSVKGGVAGLFQDCDRERKRWEASSNVAIWGCSR